MARLLLCVFVLIAALYLGIAMPEQMPRMLARIMMAKEGNDKAAAESALALVAAVTNRHISDVLQPESMGKNAPPVRSTAGFDTLQQPSSQAAPVEMLSKFITAMQSTNVSTLTLTGPDFLAYSPCVASTQPRLVSLSLSAINIVPEGLDTAPVGVGIFPLGIAIQPCLAFIQPTGIDILPTGISIFPSLLSVSPTYDEVSPAGFEDASTAIQVGGRKLQAKPPASLRERFFRSYMKWVSLICNIAMAEDSHLPQIQEALNETFGKAREYLETLKVSNSSMEVLPPLKADPELLRDNSDIFANSLGMIQISSAFFSFSPCLVSTTPAAISLVAAAIDIQPVGIYTLPYGVEIKPVGVLVIPTLLNVSPNGALLNPSGLAITPSLINASPAFHILNPVGVSRSHSGVTFPVSRNDQKLSVPDQGNIQTEQQVVLPGR